ncbi:MAG TPA: glycosyltransferase [Candidatus Angelobacter sp.]|nr:glycosyltransferase [Candidatus Angelobacter sp.]
MRILHVITGLEAHGAETMLFKLLSARSAGYEAAVVSLAREGELGPRIAALGVPIYSLGLRGALPNPAAALALRRITRSVRPQLIQGWMPHGNLMASLAGAFAREYAPVLWNVRMSLYSLGDLPWRTSCLIRLGARLSSRPAAIIYNSQVGAKQHEAIGYNAARRVVIPNGFDCQMFRPDQRARQEVRAELGVSDGSVLIGLIARYHPMKDHLGFLRAAGMLASRYPLARFVLIGRGVTQEDPALLAMIAEQHLQGRVFLLGQRLDTLRLTAALDVACSASFWGEGFSNAIGEAMACGIPCVATDIGDSAYVVAEAGMIVPPRNPEAFAYAMAQLIEAGPERRRELGDLGRRRIETEFSLPVVVRRYEDLYQEQLARVRKL